MTWKFDLMWNIMWANHFIKSIYYSPMTTKNVSA